MCSQLVIHVCTGLEKGLRGTGEELGKSCDRWGAESGREIGEGIRAAGQEAGQGLKNGKRCLYDQVTEYTCQLVYRTALFWCTPHGRLYLWVDDNSGDFTGCVSLDGSFDHTD